MWLSTDGGLDGHRNGRVVILMGVMWVGGIKVSVVDDGDDGGVEMALTGPWRL